LTVLISHEQVLKFLPHREPFLFIDSVESLVKNERPLIIGETIPVKDTEGLTVTAHYHTRADHPIFAGHFPGYPILPGVVQVEMMAQASAFGIVPQLKDPFSVKLEVFFMGVDEVKFRKPVLPEMDLKIVTTCLKARGMVMSYSGKIYHQDQLMSEASSILAMVKF
jgi:3-hydroxyacyl-[acyl-carrier-protein] dehydratase